ncbi:hypothetical protein CPAV1605_401 [seawater metagenome]|uniref:Uncharacterized protein n=1 Tax=seawater metagenome TaxID=1561972 RepID=A0A5E8CHX8_9ZZZZ
MSWLQILIDIGYAVCSIIIVLLIIYILAASSCGVELKEC